MALTLRSSTVLSVPWSAKPACSWQNSGYSWQWKKIDAIEDRFKWHTGFPTMPVIPNPEAFARF
jgi:hypothetical protein